MKLRPFLALVILSLPLTACPKKQAEDATENAGQPAEGSTTSTNDNSPEGGSEEMQDKQKDAGETEPAAPAEPPVEDKN